MQRAERAYDVALSFAGEQRKYVEAVANLLRDAGVSVFYDDHEQAALWGEDLTVHLDRVYRSEARYVVPFISAAYAHKAWPRQEFRSALAAAVEQQEPYILPIRFDETTLPGLRPTIHYLDGTRLTPAEIVRNILQKLGRQAAAKAASSETPRTLPKLPPTDFNPYSAAEEALTRLRQELDTHSAELRASGFGVHSQDRGGRFIFRVMHAGDAVYSLDAWISDDFGENTICFYGAQGRPSSTGGTNAHGTIAWDPQRGASVIKLQNLSLLPMTAQSYVFAAEELAEAIWQVMSQRLRSQFE
jgi:hypothetical protein